MFRAKYKRIKNNIMRKQINFNNLSTFLLIISLTVFSQLAAQTPTVTKPKPFIDFPDIPGYKTLKCDFHQHTVFSDGEVWPTIRVKEAIRDGLDAISITDHLEVQPNKSDIPHTDRNRGYQIATKEIKGRDILVINGAEITRDMPPGHINAIFIKDANKLLLADPIEVYREAKRQGAFIFWNHPSWIAQQPDGVATLTNMHKELLKEGLINGIEVVNAGEYSDEAFQMAIDYNLTIMGNSDIHGLIDWEYNPSEGKHRPITLVFAKEKSETAIKEGLENRRTAVWFDNTLIGSAEYLIPLIQTSLVVKRTEILQSYKGKSLVQEVYIENNSDADYILENKSDFLLHNNTDILTLKAHALTPIQVKTLELLPSFNLRFNVLNAFVAPHKHPEIMLKINGAK